MENSLRLKLSVLVKQMASQKEILVACLIVLLLAGGSFLMFALRQDKKPQYSENSASVNVSAATTQNNSVAQADATGDNKVKWVKNVNVNESSNDVSLDGTIVEEILPTQEFSGDLDLPKGWTAQYSVAPLGTAEANRNYQAYDPASPPATDVIKAITYLKINTGVADTLKPYTQAPLVQPLDAAQLVTDGSHPLAPILYNNKLFLVMRAVRAVGSANKMIDCFDLTTYQRCTGGGVTFPTYLSATGTSSSPTLLGTGTRNISTPYNMQHVLEEDDTFGHKGRLYFPGQSGNNYGVTCVDLQNLKNCGFTVLGTSAAPTGTNPVLVSGFVRKDNKLYGHANDADVSGQVVVCYDLATSAKCTGTEMMSSMPHYLLSEHAGSYDTPGNHIISGNKMYWLVNYRFGNTTNFTFYAPWDTYLNVTQRNFGTRMACFDLNTRTNCAGFNFNPMFVDAGGKERVFGLYTWKQPGNVDYAMCIVAGVASGFDIVHSCFNKDTAGSVGVPQMLPSQWIWKPWSMMPNSTTITDSSNGHTKTYFSMYKTGIGDVIENSDIGAAITNSATVCYDWDAQANCEGMTRPRYWHEVNNGYSAGVGYAYDGACMWAVGYTGHIWSFDAKSGETPCRTVRSDYTATLNTSDFYCNTSGRVFNWGKARLAKGSMYDFQKFNIKVKNNNGTVLTEKDIKNDNQQLDLTELSYQDNSQLKVEVDAKVYNTSPWADGALPYMNIVSNSDSVEYCYTTKVKPQCDIADIKTISNAVVKIPTDTMTSSKTTTIPVNQPADKQCFRDLKISVTNTSNQVKNNETVTYNIRVDNKANKDPDNRGSVPSVHNPEAAYLEAVVAGANVSIVSASDGGVISGNGVIWDDQSIPAAEYITRSVTVKAPASVVGMESPAKSNVAYAATTQRPLTLYAAIAYGGDTYQSDNTGSNSGVVFVNETLPPPTPTPTTPEPTEEELPNTLFLDPPPARVETPRSERQLTPSAIRSIIPPSFSSSVESVFKAVNAAVTPISPTVAEAVPYSAIAFLAAFALVYAYQAIQETRTRRQMRLLIDRFKRTEATRKNYIDLTSHYLNTPITTMQSTVELLRSLQQLPQATAEAAQARLQRLVQHSQSLLGESQALSDESSKAIATVAQVKVKPFVLTSGFIIPTVGVLAVALLANVLFVWAEKYNANLLSVAMQVGLYLLGAVALAAAYHSFRQQRFATKIAEQELKLEQEVTASQSKFISKSGTVLQNDVLELDQLAPSITAQPKGKTFAAGLHSLKSAISKMMYLNSLTTHATVPVIADNTIKDLAEEVLVQARPYAAQNQVTLNVSIEPGLTALVDIDGFRQLLSSTLDNAIKFNHQGGQVDLTIANHSDNSIRIIVQDNGAGIPKERVEQLFTPFARGSDTLEFNYEGFGLDLYMDKLIAEQCGGSIAVDSKPGVGTKVTITLPS